MSQEAYEELRRELLGGHEVGADLYRRWQEVKAQEAQCQAEREQAQADGLPVPRLFEDPAHTALFAERHTIMETLGQKFAQPRLDAAAMAALRSQLSPEEKSRLRHDLLTSLQSSPPEIKKKTVAAMDKVMLRLRVEHGSTPEVEAALAKVERLKEQLGGAE